MPVPLLVRGSFQGAAGFVGGAEAAAVDAAAGIVVEGALSVPAVYLRANCHWDP